MKRLEIRTKWMLAGAGGLLIVLALIWFHREPSVLEVPLGVEHAVAVTYSGQELVVKAYGYGVAVSLRIAGVQERDGARTYDIRYMLNRGGIHNITEYLTAADGSDPVGLPDFPVRGMETLSVGVDKRIQELRTVDISIWHYYYETMAVLIGLWLLWLGLIIFWPREKTADAGATGPLTDPFPALLRRYLEQIRQGSLGEADKARLERMLIHHWRGALPVSGLRMHATLRRIGADPQFGSAYARLVDWLHNPGTAVSDADVVQALTPYAHDDEESAAS